MYFTNFGLGNNILKIIPEMFYALNEIRIQCNVLLTGNYNLNTNAKSGIITLEKKIKIKFHVGSYF